jgi:hypothetical protein
LKGIWYAVRSVYWSNSDQKFDQYTDQTRIKGDVHCPALEVSVAFLKQPALPSKAPQTNFFFLKTKKNIINKT